MHAVPSSSTTTGLVSSDDARRRWRIGASSWSLNQNETSNIHPFGDFGVGSISPITRPTNGKNANGTHFNCSIEARSSSSLLTQPGSYSTSSIEKSKESAILDVGFQFNNEDTVEWSNTTFFQDETDVDKFWEVISKLGDDGKKKGLPSSKDKEQLKGSVRRKRGRKPETSPYQSEQVAAIQKFLELRSLNNTDMAHWATVADSELVYTSPGLPPRKGSAGTPMKKREVRGLNAVAFDMDVYRMFSNSLRLHFEPRRVATKVSLELEPNDVLVTGDKGMATVFLRCQGLQALGLRKLEQRGMLFCQFKPGTSRLTSLELSVDMAQVALKISPLLKILSPLPVAGSLAVLGSSEPYEESKAVAGEFPTIGDAPLAFEVMGASEHDY